MQHAATWTRISSPHRLILTQDYPEYATVAREFVRSRPDVGALKFKQFWVSNLAGGQIAHVTIKLESHNWRLHVEVRNEGARLVARAVMDEAKNPWER